MDRITHTVVASANLAEARERFLADVGTWVRDCIERYADVPPNDVHDQATYTTGWEPYIQQTGDTKALAFMQQVRDEIRAHFTNLGLWKHGYWTMQEAHHGTEHFELFLGALFRLAPEDEVTQAQLLDAAEHIGNWCADVPPWFDEATGLFRSMYLGTQGARIMDGAELNVPDHLRFVNLCLLAYDMSGKARYLALATRYAQLWAEAIVAAPMPPVGLLPSGPVYELIGDAERVYRGFAGMAGHLDDAVDRTENLLASGAINSLLKLWALTEESVFRSAAERLLDTLATQLGDPDAGAAADAIRAYRRATGDTRYDEAVLQALAPLAPYAIQTLSIEPKVLRATRPHGIGKRKDTPNWYEDGQPRKHHPILLAVAAEIQQDDALATRAMDLARTYFALACKTLPDGRQHGCAANTVSAITRGHGRENHAGMMTGVLGVMPTPG